MKGTTIDVQGAGRAYIRRIAPMVRKVTRVCKVALAVFVA